MDGGDATVADGRAERPVSACHSDSSWPFSVIASRWFVITRSALPSVCHFGIAARPASAFFDWLCA